MFAQNVQLHSNGGIFANEKSRPWCGKVCRGRDILINFHPFYHDIHAHPSGINYEAKKLIRTRSVLDGSKMFSSRISLKHFSSLALLLAFFSKLKIHVDGKILLINWYNDDILCKQNLCLSIFSRLSCRGWRSIKKRVKTITMNFMYPRQVCHYVLMFVGSHYRQRRCCYAHIYMFTHSYMMKGERHFEIDFGLLMEEFVTDNKFAQNRIEKFTSSYSPSVSPPHTSYFVGLPDVKIICS